MPLTEAEKHRITGDRDLGQLFQFSGSEDVRSAGKLMNVQAEKRLAEESRYRAPISLGRGIMVDPRTGAVTENAEYKQSLIDEHDRKATLQAQKDVEAKARAKIMATAKADQRTQMGTAEKKLYRLAGDAAGSLPAITALVEANPDAFGASKDVTQYAPDWMPNLLTEGAKNWQTRQLTDSQQKARNSVYEQAYKIINDLAGAALSVHEKARIEAFTPSPNDDARTIVNKLRSAQQTADRMHSSFGMYSDYQPLPQTPVAPVAGSQGLPKAVSRGAVPLMSAQNPAQAATPTGETKTAKGKTYHKFTDGTWRGE